MADDTSTPAPPFDALSFTRPDPALMTYYLLVAALTLIAFPIVILPLYFKYRTLTYAFDDKGVSMSYGVLFRKEVYLTYRRIQDTHVTRNILHRWLGLSEVAVQTASGAAGAEMTIEGVRNAEGLRDFLYSKMRGASDSSDAAGESDPADGSASPGDEALALLQEIRDGLRQVRQAREASS